jgi:hypothetical protein
MSWIRWMAVFLLSARGVLGEVSFNREVRPILAENCFECHGPSKAKGKLRLDVPGYTKTEEILRRVKTTDVEDHMPPKDSGKAGLDARQIGILEKWIAEGAKREGHWAFQKIARPSVPAAVEARLANNPIDNFVQKKLSEHGLKAGARASEEVLRRRVSFDLNGLPARAEKISYEAQVENCLASPRFGERMAVWWLDLVRYADSEGYFFDYHRNVYPYRDYVIRAFNENKRFDRFTMEQLAGDLIPGAGWEEKIASGYNRLIMTTQEDGANVADYRARYAADRVRNLGSVWLGLTLGCAQCHDHKFDPIPTADFYRTAAFFADIKEQAIHKEPEVFVGTGSKEYEELLEQTAAVQRLLATERIEASCEQVIAEEKIVAGGGPPEYWPRSAKTDEVVALMRKRASQPLTAREDEIVAAYFRRHYDQQLYRELNKLGKARERFEAGREQTLVTEAGPVRTVRILARGNWLDENGPEVGPAFLEAIGGSCAEKERLTRLDLARWLVSAENPVTARVLANRLWQLFFGVGIVQTLDDFGAQGAAPSNPELLDWLGTELIESGWDVKHLVQLIVTSHTYQQDSAKSEGDTANEYFGRQNAIALSAEFVRDNTLAIAGLLSSGMGGPSIKTYSPEFLEVVDTQHEEPVVTETGERLYRRGVYLYRKRTNLHPTLAAFDASAREQCVSQRNDGRTPQEPLALLNAPEFVEAARGFAERIYNAADNDCERVKAAFEMALGRAASEKEVKVLMSLLEEQRAFFAKDKTAAAKFVRIGKLRWAEKMSADELAAWTNVARALLNLEETNTRY